MKNAQTRVAKITLAVLVALAVSISPRAEADEGWESTAKQLQQSVVLIRARSAETPPKITLLSGAAVGPDLIITTADAAVGSPRITLPGGAQAQAKVLVVDEVSGLALLRLTNAKLPPLEVASQAPAVGSWVMSGSAYGGEPAAVSLGVIGGANRMIGGGALPPLMQCDLRTTNTSSGGPIVDRGGRLLSVVIAVDDGNKRAGWTYAAPASHVSRILREWKERGDKQDQNQELLVLKRRRPVVGLVLDQEGALIVVGRVHANSPAASAGLKPGDRIVAVDGVHIRSVYQAVRPLLFKQPGEQVTYRIRRAGDEQPEREIQVALGDQQAVLAKGPLRAPKLDVVTTPGGYRSEAGDRKRELVHPDDPRKKPVVTTPQRQIELLEQALDGYRNVIIYQQDQIRDLKKRLEQLEKAGEPRQ